MTQHPGAMEPAASQPPTTGPSRWALAAVVLLALSSLPSLRALYFAAGRVLSPLAEGVVEGAAVLDLLSGITVGTMPGTAALLAGAAMMGSPRFARIAGVVGLVQTSGTLVVLTMMAVGGAGIIVVSGAATAIMLLPVAAMVLVQGRGEDPEPRSGAHVATAALAVLSAFTFGVAPVVLTLSDTMLFVPLRIVLTSLIAAALLTSLPAVAAAFVASWSRPTRWAGVVISVASALLAAVNTLTVLATRGAMSHAPAAAEVAFMVLTPIALGAAAVCAVFAARARHTAEPS